MATKSRHGLVVTDQQARVLALLAEGQENKEAARVLGVTPYTFASHVGDILRRIEAKNRTHAVAIALRRGLIA